MEIRGTIVQGMFKYFENIKYTAGDLILHESELYVVIAGEYSGGNEYPPDKEDARDNPRCVRYARRHQYGPDNRDPLALITADSFQTIVNEYFKGLRLDGSLSRVTIASEEDFARYLHNGAYDCSVTYRGSVPGMVPPGRYILRVYRTEEGSAPAITHPVTQEFTALDGSAVYRVSFTAEDSDRREYSSVLSSPESFRALAEHLNELHGYVARASRQLERMGSAFKSLSVVRNGNGDWDIADPDGTSFNRCTVRVVYELVNTQQPYQASFDIPVLPAYDGKYPSMDDEQIGIDLSVLNQSILVMPHELGTSTIGKDNFKVVSAYRF